MQRNALNTKRQWSLFTHKIKLQPYQMQKPWEISVSHQRNAVSEKSNAKSAFHVRLCLEVIAGCLMAVPTKTPWDSAWVEAQVLLDFLLTDGSDATFVLFRCLPARHHNYQFVSGWLRKCVLWLKAVTQSDRSLSIMAMACLDISKQMFVTETMNGLPLVMNQPDDADVFGKSFIIKMKL